MNKCDECKEDFNFYNALYLFIDNGCICDNCGTPSVIKWKFQFIGVFLYVLYFVFLIVYQVHNDPSLFVSLAIFGFLVFVKFFPASMPLTLFKDLD